jgi:hypothetical protein
MTTERVVFACRCFRPELESLRRPDTPVRVEYLSQNLHRTPDRLTQALQRAIDSVGTSASEVVLGYGLCSNGVVGLRSERQTLVIPRAHDCISLLLGSRQAYREAFARRPGSYYLTPGWLELERDPLGTLEQDYVPRVGREDGEWTLREELKHYTHIVYLRSKEQANAQHRARAAANARFFAKELDEIEASMSYLQRLLDGPHEPPDFIAISPGETVTQAAFFD